MKQRDDSGQIKFWQVGIGLVIFLVLAFDLLSPQLLKIQLRDKADNIAIQESQSFVRGGRSNYSDAYYQVCKNVRSQLAAYGAILVPGPESQDLPPDQICPSVSEDGRVQFRAQKKAPSILIGRFALKDYYLVTIDADEKYTI